MKVISLRMMGIDVLLTSGQLDRSLFLYRCDSVVSYRPQGSAYLGELCWCLAGLSLSSIIQTRKEAVAAGSPSQHEQSAQQCRIRNQIGATFSDRDTGWACLSSVSGCSQVRESLKCSDPALEHSSRKPSHKCEPQMLRNHNVSFELPSCCTEYALLLSALSRFLS